MLEVDKEASEIIFIVKKELNSGDFEHIRDYLDRKTFTSSSVESFTLVDNGTTIVSTDRDNFRDNPYVARYPEYTIKSDFIAFHKNRAHQYTLMTTVNLETINSMKKSLAFDAVIYSFIITFALLAVQMLSLLILYKTTFRRFFDNVLKHKFDESYFLEEIQILNNTFKNILDQLSRQKNMFYTLFNNLPLPVYYKNRNGQIVECNQAFIDIMPQSEKESLVGRQAGELLAQEDADYFRNMDEMIFSGEKSIKVFEKKLKLNGKKEFKDVVFYRTAVKDNNNDIDGLISIAIDVTEKKYQQNLQDIQMAVAASFLLEDETGIFDRLNKILIEYFTSEFGFVGYIDDNNTLICPSMSTEIFSKCKIDSKSNIFPSSEWGGIWGQCIREKKIIYQNEGMHVPVGHISIYNALAVPIISNNSTIGEFVMGNKDGGFTEMDSNAAAHISGIIAPVLKHWYKNKRHEENLMQEKALLEAAVAKEIAIKHKQEQMLFEQKKFADMGQMMSAIAHQWRQPLNALAMVSQNLAEKYKDSALSDEYVEDFEQHSMKLIMHMSETIDHFRNFFAPDKEKETFEAIQEIVGLLKLINVQIESKGIRLELSCRCSDTDTYTGSLADFIGCRHRLSKITGFPGEFKQSIINIVYNAVDAMKDAKEEGRITKGILKVSIDVRDSLIIVISDNGGGIPKEIISSIFDPYFSTKGEGKGTGIGLYMTKMIIETHMGGTLKAENSDIGAVFTISLPLA